MSEGDIAAADVPQASTRLGRVRAAIEALARGARTTGEVAALANVSMRHAHYHLAAARALGWAERAGRGHSITGQGSALLETSAGTAEEHARFVAAVRSSALLIELASDLEPRAADLEARIAERLMARAGLGRATALARAQTLASWIRRASDPQLVMPSGLENEVRERRDGASTEAPAPYAFRGLRPRAPSERERR